MAEAMLLTTITSLGAQNLLEGDEMGVRSTSQVLQL